MHLASWSRGKTGAEDNTPHTSTINKEQYTSHNARGCCTSNSYTNSNMRKTTFGDTAPSKCTHVLWTKSHQPCVHTNSPLTTRCQKCPIAHWALRFAYGAPSNRRDNLQLQKVDARPSNSWDMVNGIWQGLWRHGPRWLNSLSAMDACDHPL